MEHEGMHVGILVLDPFQNQNDGAAMIATPSVGSFMGKTMPDFLKHLGEGNVILSTYSKAITLCLCNLCHRSNVLFIIGEHHKPSAASVKSDLVKKVQALLNKKYGTFVIHDLNSTLINS